MLKEPPVGILYKGQSGAILRFPFKEDSKNLLTQKGWQWSHVFAAWLHKDECAIPPVPYTFGG